MVRKERLLGPCPGQKNGNNCDGSVKQKGVSHNRKTGTANCDTCVRPFGSREQSGVDEYIEVVGDKKRDSRDIDLIDRLRGNFENISKDCPNCGDNSLLFFPSIVKRRVFRDIYFGADGGFVECEKCGSMLKDKDGL